MVTGREPALPGPRAVVQVPLPGLPEAPRAPEARFRAGKGLARVLLRPRREEPGSEPQSGRPPGPRSNFSSRTPHEPGRARARAFPAASRAAAPRARPPSIFFPLPFILTLQNRSRGGSYT